MCFSLWLFLKKCVHAPQIAGPCVSASVVLGLFWELKVSRQCWGSKIKKKSELYRSQSFCWSWIQKQYSCHLLCVCLKCCAIQLHKSSQISPGHNAVKALVAI